MVPSQKVRPRIAPRPTVRGTSARKPLGPNIVTVMASIVVDPLRAWLFLDEEADLGAQATMTDCGC